MAQSNTKRLLYQNDIVEKYPDVLNADALIALEKLAELNDERIALMQKRDAKRQQRFANKERITFLESDGTIGGSNITVADARAGKFSGPHPFPKIYRGNGFKVPAQPQNQELPLKAA